VKKYFLILILFYSQLINGDCLNSFAKLPTLQNGRVKPLFIHARETIKYLTGKSSMHKMDSTALYCLLSTNKLAVTLTTPIKHIEVKKILNLNSDQNDISLEILSSKQELIRSKLMRMDKPSPVKNILNDLFNKIETYNEIKSRNDWKVAQILNNKIVWKPLHDITTTDTNLSSMLEKSKEDFIKIHGDDYLLELTYAKLNLTMISLIFVILSLISLVVFKNLKIPTTLSIFTLLIQLAYLVFRTIISGRPPLTNMYESVIFSGFAALFLSIIFSYIKKDKILLLVGLICNLCSLFMINFSGQMFSSSIGPLVTVLKDNFWLSTHVSAVIIGYGALALSWILSNIVLIQKRFFFIDETKEKYYCGLIYLCLKFGVTFLAAGILLGAIWADYAWGRFWGWDPKETWSLITLFIYMIILHGRFTSWIKTSRFITLTALAFMSVMMAWFGVNYILATGLHSYGHSEGGTIFLILFFTIQSALVLVTTKYNNKG